MPQFSTSDSITATQANNLLRGLFRDNTDRAVTGTTSETIFSAQAITGGTIGATGGLLVFVCGTISGINGTKTFRLRFGGVSVATITQAAGTTSDWYFWALMQNTATNAQRWFVLRNTNDALTSTFDYTTGSIDTTANQNIEVTGQLGNAADTMTQTMFDAFEVQIT